MKIGFIGLGKLGLPCAEAMAQKNEVTGYDVLARDSDIIDVVTDLELATRDKDIVFVAVPTPHHPDYDGSKPTSHLPNKDFDYDQVKKVLAEVNAYANEHTLVVLISTVLPGTVRRELAPIITQAKFIYNPYLIAMGSVAWDMVNPEMIIIGTETGLGYSHPVKPSDDVEVLTKFYGSIMQNHPRCVVGTYEEAESIKIFYNTFISSKLSLVNMIQDVALKIGHMDVDIVTDALARSTQRIMGPQYMTAGMGDGGACHPRDNIALRWMAQELDLGYDLFDSIMTAREKQAKNMAKFLLEQAEKYDLPLLIHGVAYKPGVEYVDGSYSLLVAHYLNEAGRPPMLVDPFTHPDPGPFQAVVLLAHSATTTYKYYPYSQQKNVSGLYCELDPGCIIVDPWRQFPKNSNYAKVIHYGNTRDGR